MFSTHADSVEHCQLAMLKFVANGMSRKRIACASVQRNLAA